MTVGRKATHAVACFVAVMALSLQSFAKSHPFSADFEQKVQKTFFEGGKISTAKVDAYILRLTAKRGEVRSILAGEERRQGETNEVKIAEKVDDKGVLTAFDAAIKNLQDVKSAQDEATIYELISAALDIEAAVRIQGNINVFSKVLVHAGAVLGSWSIPKTSSAEAEASNLFDYRTNSYLSVAQIKALKAQNVDLSMFGPGKSSPFWQAPKSIAAVDVRAAANGKTTAIYSDFSGFPTENVFMYEGVKQSDTKPKLDVTFRDAQGKKQKLKLKFGAEIHADPTVAALMLTMGFPADLTKYTKNIKVILGKSTLSDMKRDWEVFYRRDASFRTYKVEDYITESGVDSEGRNFVVFKEGLLEAKPKDITRVGGWKFGENGHSNLREVRALMLVQLWLDNNDVKEFDNNQLLLKQTADGRGQRSMVISDLGHALGGMLLESPNMFSWEMIGTETDSAYNVKFLSLQPAKIKNKITLADARWATRLIASLTREQISTAVAIAGWPTCIQQIYVEKLISRRNDLVKHFGLTASAATMTSSDAHKQLKLNSACDSAEVKKDYTTDFDLSVSSLLKPVAGGIYGGLKKFAQAGINSQRKISISGNHFKFATQEIVDVILNVRRDIERNPSPKSEKDLYIVKDQFEVGFRLGISYGAYKDLIYTRTYTLAYPVRTFAEGQTNNGFLVNVLLPFDIRDGNVPESFVLKTEHSIENGVGVNFNKLMGLGAPVVKAGVAKIHLWRSIMDHRDAEQFVLYRDRSDFTEASLSLSVRALFVKLPVFKTIAGWGSAVGRGSVFTQADVAANPEKSRAITKAVVEGDFDALQTGEKQFDLTNKFNYRRKKWSFIFWKTTSESRYDNIVMTTEGESKNALQYTSSKTNSGGFISTNEHKTATVEVYADPTSPSQFRLAVGVIEDDQVTTEKEMAKYLKFINGLSVTGAKVINFDPANGYTTNKSFGATLTKSDTEYSAKAVENMLNVTEATFWATLASAKGLTTTQMDKLKATHDEYVKARRDERSPIVNDRMILESFDITADDAELIQEAKAFIKRLTSLKKEDRLEKKVRALAEAFRKAVYTNSSGFYEPALISTMSRVAGNGNFYSRSEITKPAFTEMNLIEGVPLFGEIGRPLAGEMKYLVFSPQGAVDLYTMFDSWF